MIVMQSPYSRRASAAALLLVAILGISTASAQDQSTNTSTGDVAAPTTDSGSESSKGSTPTTDSGSESSNVATPTTNSGSDSSNGPTPTNLPNLSSATQTSDLPGLTTSGLTTSGLPNIPTDLPTLPGGYNYPPPTVPPTQNAPYMRKSNLPQDLVFIVVGAAIAFVAVSILAWRVFMAWSINRPVRRAVGGYSQVGTDTKGGRRKSAFEPYGHASKGSTMSLEKLGSSHKHVPSMTKGQAPNSSLFFSPTAGAGMHTAGSNRASTYLPSGYYAAGTAPGNGAGTAVIGGTGSVSKLRPHSGAPVRAFEPSPPDSPEFRPSTAGASIMDSRSSLNAPAISTGGRTPSSYLDDLMSGTVPSDVRLSSVNNQGMERDRGEGGGRRTYRD